MNFFSTMEKAEKKVFVFLSPSYSRECLCFISYGSRSFYSVTLHLFFDFPSCFSTVYKAAAERWKTFSSMSLSTYVKLLTLSVTRMINQSQDAHSPSRGTYIFKYRQSSEWLVSIDFILRSWANRPLGISNSASMPVSDTGTLWGQTGEKWSAKRVFFHVDGVTGGMYLIEHKYRQKKMSEKEDEKWIIFCGCCCIHIGLLISFVRVPRERFFVSRAEQVGDSKKFLCVFRGCRTMIVGHEC